MNEELGLITDGYGIWYVYSWDVIGWMFRDERFVLHVCVDDEL